MGMTVSEAFNKLDALNRPILHESAGDNRYKEVIQLLQPYKESMLKLWGKVKGKVYTEFPENYRPIDTDRCAILIPGIEDKIYMANTHLDMYLSSWEAVYRDIDTIDKIFNISQNKDLFNRYKLAVKNNKITREDDKYESAEVILEDYLYEDYFDGQEYYQELFASAPLEVVNTTYLRAEDTYLYWVAQCGGKMNSYQREQVEKFLDSTFYSPVFKEKGIEIWGYNNNNTIKMSAAEGYIVDDVMKQIRKICG